MKQIFKTLLYACLLAMGLFLLVGLCLWSWVKWHYDLPPEQRVQDQFQSHKSDYVRLAALLQKDREARFVDRDGRVDGNGIHKRLVPEYANMIRKIGAQSVLVEDDGSMEFGLYGFGCAICSDSYMGVYFSPNDHKTNTHGWVPRVVRSLDSTKLPQDDGAVASGLYVVPIESEWFIYRFEYQE